MKNVPDILEIPVDKAKSVGDLADWFEANELHHKKHPSLTLPVTKELPVMAIMALFVMVGMALIVLEDKGILKVKAKKKRSKEDFLDLINTSKTEEKLEELIETRYGLDLILGNGSISSAVSEPATEYGLSDAFGIWKNKKDTLAKVRETQWGKRK